MSYTLDTYLDCDHFTDQSVRAAHNLNTKDDDVFVVIYPRTGATWIQNILLGLKHGAGFLDGITDLGTLFQHSPFLEFTLPFIKESLESRAGQVQSPRFFKTHLPAQAAPKEIFEKNRKCILFLRNPKDILISYYKFHTLNDALKSPESLEVFTEDFINGKVTFGSFWEWNKNWLDHAEKNPQTCLVLFYEELLDDFDAGVQKMAKFVGYSITADEMKKLKDMTSLDNMRERIKFFEGFFGPGKKQTYKKELPAAVCEKIDKITKEKLSKTDHVNKFLV